MMKKILILLLGASLMASFSGYVVALDSDTFTVTASGAYLECNIVNTTWAIGNVNMSGHYWTNATGKTQLAETYNCTAGVNIDFEMTVSTDAAVWDVAAAPTADKYGLNASSDSWAAMNEGLELASYSDVKSNFAPGDNASFDLRFDAPTSTSTGATQTITLTGKVTTH